MMATSKGQADCEDRGGAETANMILVLSCHPKF